MAKKACLAVAPVAAGGLAQQCEFCGVDVGEDSMTVFWTAGKLWVSCFRCASRLARASALVVADPRVRLLIADLAEAKRWR